MPILFDRKEKMTIIVAWPELPQASTLMVNTWILNESTSYCIGYIYLYSEQEISSIYMYAKLTNLTRSLTHKIYYSTTVILCQPSNSRPNDTHPRSSLKSDNPVF